MTSSQIELDFTKQTEADQKVVCHLLPCRIDHDELEVRAKEYFWPTIRELQKGGDHDQGRKTTKNESTSSKDLENKKNPILTASFRGRPLQGRCLKLPDGYSGHVINKPDKMLRGPATSARNKMIAKHFDEFTYWNWDELPESTDNVVKALGWLGLAKSIHDPL